MNETTVQTKNEWGGNLTDIKENEEKVISTPIFIIFAEYLGYVSRFSKIVLEWCEGNTPEMYVRNIIRIEANAIFRQMKKDYTLPTIRYWYETYYPIILRDFEEKLIANSII